MHFETLSFEKRDRIAILSLNQPKTLNALTVKMKDEIRDALAEIKNDQEIKVMILTGEGKSFCSGGDFDSAFAMFDDPPAEAKPKIINFYKTFLAIRDLAIPTIAVIKGHTVGAGLCLALTCDMRIASTDTKMSMSFIKVGIHPGMGGSFLLPRLIGTAKALEMCLTGEPIDIQEAQRIGLVNHLVEPDRLMDFALDLAGRIAKNPAVPARLLKKSIYRSMDTDLDDALDFESFSQLICASTWDMKEAIRAFKEKRPPVFKDR